MYISRHSSALRLCPFARCSILTCRDHWCSSVARQYYIRPGCRNPATYCFHWDTGVCIVIMRLVTWCSGYIAHISRYVERPLWFATSIHSLYSGKLRASMEIQLKYPQLIGEICHSRLWSKTIFYRNIFDEDICIYIYNRK